MYSQTQTLQRIQRSRTVARSPVFYGWVVWAIATLGIIASVPGQSYTVSLFIDHYIAEFGLGRTTVSGLFGLGTFLAAFALTWIGRRIDRNGNRIVGVIVAALFAVVLMSLSLIAGPLTLFLSFLAIRLLGQGSMVLVSTTAIAQWWRHRRGWVMGLALVSFALFQRIYLPALQQIIETVGWRTAWVILGLAVGIVVAPLWWLLMRDRPENFGLRPDGEAVNEQSGGEGESADEIDDEVNWTLPEARKTLLFWTFVLGRMVPAAWGTGLIFHQVSVFADQGYTAAEAANTYGLLALVNAIAVLGIGRIINRVRPGYVMAFQLTMLIAALTLSTMLSTAWLLPVYAVTFGVVMATGASFDGSVWADVYGRQHHGAIRGFATTAMIIGTSVGPIIFGFSHDHFGGYQPVIFLGVAIALIPLALSLLVNRPPLQDVAA